MNKVIQMLITANIDNFTKLEIKRFVEKKLDEAEKIRGQIARDLNRIGGKDSFLNPKAYDELKKKYLRGHQSRKKLAILELDKKLWCKVIDYD